MVRPGYTLLSRLPKKEGTVPSRHGRNYLPSRPVVKKYMRRPVPSSKKCMPSRPVVTTFIYRPVVTIFIYRPVMKQKVIELYRPVPSRKLAPTVPSRPIQATIISLFYRPVPSSIFFLPNMSRQYRPVPSGILPAMKSLDLLAVALLRGRNICIIIAVLRNNHRDAVCAQRKARFCACNSFRRRPKKSLRVFFSL